MKFTIPDKLARLYNEALDEFLRAQQRFNQKYGRQWNPDKDPIAPHWSKQHRRAWNEFGRVMSDVIAKEGPFHENDVMEDFLVKNVVALATVDYWGRGLTLVVGAGAMYGWLKRP